MLILMLFMLSMHHSVPALVNEPTSWLRNHCCLRALVREQCIFIQCEELYTLKQINSTSSARKPLMAP
jgi:hypothetical protein